MPDVEAPENRFVEAVLERHKREGLDLAVKARFAAMGVIGVMLLFISPWPDVLYYEGLVLLFVLNGLAQQRIGSVGLNRWELSLLFIDLALMTVVCLVPCPFRETDLPLPFQYQFGGVIYFFVLMASATLA